MTGVMNKRDQVEGFKKIRVETTVIGVRAVGHKMETFCNVNSLKSTRVTLAKTPSNGGHRV